MKSNKLVTALVLMGLAGTAFAAKTPEELRIYINPGHGSWTGNDRALQVIGKPEYSATNTDTTGFFESNTNLIKGFGVLEALIEMGMPFDRTLNQTGERWEIGAALDLSQNIVMSRVKNGPYEANNTTSSPNYQLYNRSLAEVAREVDDNEFDQFISIHSNAATEGSTVNYHLFMYRGRNGKENVYVPGSWEMSEAAAKYSFANPHAAWSVKSVYINGDIDFMGGKDYVPTPNDRGYLGYLGVMKHNVPGYLVEGYFHTYQPARHRGMNFDVDFVEGIQYARGVAEYWEFDNRGTTGEIYGIVRDLHERFRHKLYNPNPGTDDLYKPLNGATAVLYKDTEKIAEYTTDEFYNGAFVFKGLQPGTYTVELSHPDYKAIDPIEVEVKAGATAYPKAFMEAVNYEAPKETFANYPDPYAGNGAVAPAGEYVVKSEYVDEAIPALDGLIVRRAIVRGGKMYILAFDKPMTFAASIPADEQVKATVLVYDLAKKEVVATVSTEGAEGSIAAISDIQVTADGVLLACNATKNQNSSSEIQDGDAGRGTFYIYKWANDETGLPAGNPEKWMSTQSAGLWYRAYPSRFAFSGTSTDGVAVALMPTITAPNHDIRSATFRVIDGELQAPVDNQTAAPRVALGQCDASMNILASPFDNDFALLVDPVKGVYEWNMGGHLQDAPVAGDLLKGIDGRSGIFKYAGASYIVSPVSDGTNVTGLQLLNLGNDFQGVSAATIKMDGDLAPVETAQAAAGAEVEVVRDEVSGNVTSGWINFYLLRGGKITKLTTKNVEQPVAQREYAYGLTADEKQDLYEITFSVTGDAPAADIVLTPAEGEGEVITIPVGAVVKGENTVNVTKSELLSGVKYSWAVKVTSNSISHAGVVKKENSGLTVRGGVITITDPEQPSFGYTAVGHGNNQGIDIYNPAGEKVGDRLFKGHKMFGGENGSNGKANQSNPFRGRERQGKAVFSTWGDAGYGIVAIDPIDPTAEPFSLFAGEKQGGGHFLYNGANLGGGNAGFAFVNPDDDTYVIAFSEDHEGLNGKGDTENSLVRYHIGTGWEINEAPTVLGFKNLLANTNVDLCAWGDGVFAAQIRELGSNQAGCPAFAFIADVTTEPSVALTSADESIAESVGHSSSGIALSVDGSTLAVSYRSGIGIYSVKWTDGKPALTFRYSIPVESHIWANLEFDYAGNLHAYLREQGYREYALTGASPVVTTPAPAASFMAGESSVEEIDAADAAADTDAVYYNLQGIRVAAGSLTPGIYVRVSGTATAKVIVR